MIGKITLVMHSKAFSKAHGMKKEEGGLEYFIIKRPDRKCNIPIIVEWYMPMNIIGVQIVIQSIAKIKFLLKAP